MLPALALAFLVARRVPLQRRLRELAAASGVALLVSVAWFGSMMLLPASDRPYVGDTTGKPGGDQPLLLNAKPRSANM